MSGDQVVLLSDVLNAINSEPWLCDSVKVQIEHILQELLPAGARLRACLGGKSMKQAGKEVVLTYADSNMNAYETARRLYRSGNSVLYQLQKVKEETGLDPRNFYELVKLVEMIQGSGDGGVK